MKKTQMTRKRYFIKSSEFRRIRTEVLRLTQFELGDIMGMSQQAVNRIENERRPTETQAAFIAHLQKKDEFKS